MKRPSHATVVAYLALFVALGSGAYAATQLPKNSVGPKQLKKNAVTTPKIKNGAITEAKIKDGAVTGKKVAEATLAQVPSAASATTATSAASAANASTLNGIGSDGFLQTSDVIFGSAIVETATQEPILTVPGKFQMTTTGDNENKLEVTFKNLDTTSWYYIHDGGLLFLGPGTPEQLDFFPKFRQTIFTVDSTNPADHAVVECALATTGPSRVYCSVRVPPAS